ncbi:hypothetical protein GCM10009868_25300 [Terrabacter aerolatus]|uniref:Uncharacterized protein n=1 Tax=Terrabacter aerolatus TaxID=422442 RepID=A0A512D167_9MICO|nr:hypothetical protein TAE01_20150 [Terrabacter aerolatus]
MLGGCWTSAARALAADTQTVYRIQAGRRFRKLSGGLVLVKGRSVVDANDGVRLPDAHSRQAEGP